MNDKKKKILFLDHTPFVGGAQIYLLQLIKELNEYNYKINVICTKKALKSGLYYKYKKLGIDCFIISSEKIKFWDLASIYSFFTSFFSIAKIVKKQKIDLMIGNTVRLNVIGSFISFFLRVKMIWFMHDCSFSKFLFKILSVVPVKIIYVSNFLKNFYGFSAYKHLVVKNGSNFWEEIKKVSDKNVLFLKEGIGFDKDDLIVGYAGRLVKEKGIQNLIQAFDYLNKDKMKNLKCLIIGSGKNQKNNYEKELKNMVHKRELSDKIIFLDFKNNIHEYFKIFDIFCMPSIEYESFGLSIIEAMMAKKPVIATNIGGPAEIIKDGKNGFLVEPGDPEELKNVLIKLIKNKKLREEVAERGYEEAMEKYTIKIMTEKIKKVFYEVLRK